MNALSEPAELLKSLCELGSEESELFGDVLSRLSSLDNTRAIALLSSRENMGRCSALLATSSGCTSARRAMCIVHIGRLVLRAWMCAHCEGFELESARPVSSMAESRQIVDDFNDATIEMMKSFALGALGQAPALDGGQQLPDDLACSSAYCSVLSQLLNYYNASYEPLHKWTSHMLEGCAAKELYVPISHALPALPPATLLPLINAILPILFQDNCKLITRCQWYLTYNNGTARLVSSYMRAMMAEVNVVLPLGTSDDVLLGDGESHYSSNVITSASAQEGGLAGQLSVPLKSFVSDWVENCLLNILSCPASAVPQDVIDVVKDATLLIQCNMMRDFRHKVAPSLVLKLLYCLENDRLYGFTELQYGELCCLVILLLRDVDAAGANTAHNSCFGRIFQVISAIPNPAIQGRLFKEFHAVLLHHSLIGAFPDVSTPSWSLQSALANSGELAEYFEIMLDSQERYGRTTAISCFVSSLCAFYSDLLQRTHVGLSDLFSAVRTSGPTSRYQKLLTVLKGNSSFWNSEGTQRGCASSVCPDACELIVTEVGRISTAFHAAAQPDSSAIEHMLRLGLILVRLIEGGVCAVNAVAKVLKWPTVTNDGEHQSNFGDLLSLLSHVSHTFNSFFRWSALVSPHLSVGVNDNWQQRALYFTAAVKAAQTQFMKAIENLLDCVNSAGSDNNKDVHKTLELLVWLVTTRICDSKEKFIQAHLRDMLHFFFERQYVYAESADGKLGQRLRAVMVDSSASALLGIELSSLCNQLANKQNHDRINQEDERFRNIDRAQIIADISSSRDSWTIPVRGSSMESEYQEAPAESSLLRIHLMKILQRIHDMLKSNQSSNTALALSTMHPYSSFQRYIENQASSEDFKNNDNENVLFSLFLRGDFLLPVTPIDAALTGAKVSGEFKSVHESFGTLHSLSHSIITGQKDSAVCSNNAQVSASRQNSMVAKVEEQKESTSSSEERIIEIFNAYLKTRGLDDLHEKDCDLSERQWFTLSGSADLVTVLGSTEIDTFTNTLAVRVRVFNSSGFKIPPFSLQLLVRGTNHNSDRSDLESASVATSTVWLNESYGAPLLDDNFLLPGAYFERSFNCTIKAFGACSLFVRVVYADLIYDEDDIFEIPNEVQGRNTNQRSSESSARSKKSMSAHNSHQQFKYTSNYICSPASHNAKWTAVLNCEALRVPAHSQLIPYGKVPSGAFVGSAANRIMLEQCSGISQTSFQNLWAKLGGRFSAVLPVVGALSATLSRCDSNSFLARLVCPQILDNLRRCRAALSLASMVKGAECDSSISWCMQSLFGNFVAVTLIVDNEVRRAADIGDGQWTGKLTIRCDGACTLQSVMEDAQSFVQMLTSDCAWIATK